ncbi:hypothetical protein RDSD_003116 [Oleidesulfovibrio alaskensis]
MPGAQAQYVESVVHQPGVHQPGVHQLGKRA